MSVDELIRRVTAGEPVSFQQVIATIEAHYHYTPCRFHTGLGADALSNDLGSNEGSCKIFYFAYLHGLDRQQTLSLFGDFYRQDVLLNPDGESHANIRRFLRDGWRGIRYEGVPLTPRRGFTNPHRRGSERGLDEFQENQQENQHDRSGDRTKSPL